MTFLFRVLLDASVRISLVAIAVCGVIYLFRIQSSSLRHKAWLGVLLAMLSMPVLPRIVPPLEVPVAAPEPPTAQFEVPRQQTADSAGSVAYMPPTPSAELKVGARPSTPTRTNWQALLTTWYALYLLGALFLLGRLLAGWLFAHRLSAKSSPIAVRGMTVYECANITTPFTVGLRAPRILLPRGWSDWSEEKITAVLAHEAAHVRRRDTVTGFLAHLNRVLFWFHPLAWWLQRRLALDAEEACDDAAVIALGEVHKYTEVLLDIAEAVSRRGGAFAFHGAGVDGAGLLGPRIDRLLHGLSSPRATKLQKTALVISCGIAVFFAAACQQKTLPALKADPEFASQIAPSIARNNRFQEIDRMTAADAAGLESQVLQNLDDADAREKLMTFYQSKGRRVLGDEKTTKGFWTIKLWCIEHHPEDPCSSLTEPLFDAASYQKGAKLWDTILRRPNVTPGLQVDAANYFRGADPKRAEEIAKGARIDEKKRTRLLSGIYAYALSGQSSETPYAEDLRQRLDHSTDAALLSTTGFSLERGQPSDSAASILGRKYIERAAALDPTSVNRADLTRMDRIQASAQLYRRMRAMVGTEVSKAQYQKAAALPADQRAQVMPDLAERAYWAGANRADSNHDPAGAHKDWDLARNYAKAALAVEESFRNDPAYNNRVYKADVVLAMLAVRADGDSREARKYLRSAAPIKTDDNWFPATLKLLVLLLRYGNADDRAAVIEFCELHGKVASTPGVDLLQAAQKLRQGVMPT
ncbi:MAG TPA: M56 family metallopeptidase, partial [Bryobacteraceae bacterium]|nr:M56 family metallopeptidase [Bryobacteraceae bacterium]